MNKQNSPVSEALTASSPILLADPAWRPCEPSLPLSSPPWTPPPWPLDASGARLPASPASPSPPSERSALRLWRRASCEGFHPSRRAPSPALASSAPAPSLPSLSPSGEARRQLVTLRPAILTTPDFPSTEFRLLV